MLEGLPKPLTQGPILLEPTLEAIPKVSLSMEHGRKLVIPSTKAKTKKIVQNIQKQSNKEVSLTTTPFGDEILKMGEIVAREIWDVVRNNADDALHMGSPPLSIDGFMGRKSSYALH